MGCVWQHRGITLSGISHCSLPVGSHIKLRRLVLSDGTCLCEPKEAAHDVCKHGD